jgi:hypothetical protein
MEKKSVKLHAGFVQKLFFFAAPLLAGSVISVSPSQAATLAFSEGQAIFSNFKTSPLSTDTNTDTNALAISGNGDVATFADATAFFNVTPPLIQNTSVTQVEGESGEYFGLAQSLAEAVGRFWVEDVFTFNFLVNLNLAVAVDDPVTEGASALGAITFLLFDSTNLNNPTLLDQFTLTGSLDAVGNRFTPVASASSDNILFSLFQDGQSGDTFAFSQTFAEGVYSRHFNRPTFVTLVEAKVNQATAEAVPEPSTILAIAVGGTVGIGLKLRRKPNH